MLEELRVIVDYVLPSTCVGCRRISAYTLCVACTRELRAKRVRRLYVDGCDEVYVLAAYQGVIKRVLTEIKFSSWREMSRVLAQVLNALLPEPPFLDVDLWVPMPAHPKRRRQRGFNQVETIFEPWARKHHLAYDSGFLVRTVNTQKLFHLDASQRARVMKGVFHAANAESLEGAHICLFDDIITTGATVGEVAQYLRSCGAEKVSVISICGGE